VHDTAYAALFSETARQFSAGLETLRESVRDAEERALVERITRQHRALATALFSAPGDTAAPGDVVVAEHADALRRDLDALVRLNQATVARSMAALERSTDRTEDVVLVWLAAGVIVALIAGVLITQSITRPLAALTKGAEKIGRGQFTTVAIRSRDEIGTLAQAFNSMSAQLRAMNEYKAEVMQQISHELRMPLQSMHSAYYLLSEGIRGPLTDGQREAPADHA